MADFDDRIVTMVLALAAAAATAAVVARAHFSPRAAWVRACTAVYVRLTARRTLAHVAVVKQFVGHLHPVIERFGLRSASRPRLPVGTLRYSIWKLQQYDTEGKACRASTKRQAERGEVIAGVFTGRDLKST